MSGCRRRRPGRFQRRPNTRFVYRNEKKIACLAVTSRGYTITNGVVTASRDGWFPESDLVAEIFEFKARLLVAADENTSNLVKRLKRRHLNPELMRLQTYIPDKDDPRPVCEMCRERNCHRWKAASALTLVYRFPLDCAPHYPPDDASRYPSTSFFTKINAPGASSSQQQKKKPVVPPAASPLQKKKPVVPPAASSSQKKKPVVPPAASSRKIPPASAAAAVPKRIGSTAAKPPAVRFGSGSSSSSSRRRAEEVRSHVAEARSSKSRPLCLQPSFDRRPARSSKAAAPFGRVDEKIGRRLSLTFFVAFATDTAPPGRPPLSRRQQRSGRRGTCRRFDADTQPRRRRSGRRKTSSGTLRSQSERIRRELSFLFFLVAFATDAAPPGRRPPLSGRQQQRSGRRRTRRGQSAASSRKARSQFDADTQPRRSHRRETSGIFGSQSPGLFDFRRNGNHGL